MPILELGPRDALYYEYDEPARAAGATFVFVNAISGDTSMWQGEIGSALRRAGYGTLAWNFRGQARSPFAPGTHLTDGLIVGDLTRLVETLGPPRPILTGLSIGGLYAARAYLAGCPAAALVLINTLRRMGPRLAWMNDATLRAMEVGGPSLMRDLFTPLLTGEAYQVANRQNFLGSDATYAPLPQDSGLRNLVTWMGKADWALPYEALTLPVLVLTGPHDRIFYDPAVVAELSARLPRGRRVDVPEAGHMLPVETPQKFVAALLEFAASL